jgi:hypothetical protein
MEAWLLRDADPLREHCASCRRHYRCPCLGVATLRPSPCCPYYVRMTADSQDE